MSSPTRGEPVRDEAIHDVLVVDDDPAAIRLITDVLQDKKFRIRGATDAQLGLELVLRYRPPLVVLDLILPGVSGLQLLNRILAIHPTADVILVTGNYSMDSAVEAIQNGAYDYLTKPLQVERFRQKLDKWLADTEARHRTLSLDAELVQACQFEGIVGRSPLMLDVFSRVRRIAPHFQTVLVTGESGTGKESIAKVLHKLSPNGAGPFVVCNCAAIPENLFESELFGHVQGAFTGANRDKQGFVEAARGGTLFLDEIAEIPLAAQAKLLRLLQNNEIQRLGTSRSKQVDLRIVAATNRDLRSLVADGRLREDLYYRLSMIEVRLPKLADRKEDFSLLQRYFLDRFAQRYRKPALNLSRRAQSVLAAHHWAGNIRELENVLAYACMMAEQETIDVGDFPDYLRGQLVREQPEDDVLIPMRDMELLHLQRVLDHVGGNRGRAAEILGISRTTIYRLLEKEKK